MKGDGDGAGELGRLEYQGSHEDPQMSGRYPPLELVIAYLMKRQKEARAKPLYFQACALVCRMPLLSRWSEKSVLGMRALEYSEIYLVEMLLRRALTELQLPSRMIIKPVFRAKLFAFAE